jgi:hypothetical protein
MAYKSIIQRDALKQEHLWFCTSQVDELLMKYQTRKADISTSPLTVLFAGYGRWFAGQRIQRRCHPEVLGIELVCSGNVILTKNRQDMLAEAGDVYFLRDGFPDEDRTGRG